jgi:hypothetical protein
LINEQFLEWLRIEKNLGLKSARDVLSRCRRVERVLQINLETEINNSMDSRNIVSRITKEKSKFFSPDTNVTFAFSVIARAIRLYGEFKELK